MLRPVDAWTWYTPLDVQMQLELREKLIELAQPSAADLKMLSVVHKMANKPQQEDKS